MKERPNISELEFSRSERYDKNSLSDEQAAVFEEFGIRVRSQEVLVFENPQTGEEYNVKFAGMNFYPDDKAANPRGAEDCYQQGIAAIGWDGTDPENDEPAEYMRSIIRSREEIGSHESDAAHFLLWLEEDDIILTNNDMGENSTAYHYAWVTSEPYHTSEPTDQGLKTALDRNSFGFFRYVDWVDVPQEEAPGPVTSMTLRGRTLARKKMDVLSKHQVFEQFGTKDSEDPERIDDKIDYSDFGNRLRPLAEESTGANFNELLDGLSTASSHSGLEDVVCSYIQHTTGAKIKPATQYNPVIEYLFRGLGDDEEAVTYGVQVKKGGFSQDDRSRLKRFAKRHDHLYLFSGSGDKIKDDGITNLSHTELAEYICERPQELDPTELDRLRRRVEIYEVTD